MRRDDIDYHLVPDRHLAIHERLTQWARWVRVRPTGWQVSPMFAQYRSKSWQWHRPEPKAAINVPKALAMERAVSLLPEKQREAIRFCYVFCGGPVATAKRLGVTKQGLSDLIGQGRDLLVERGM